MIPRAIRIRTRILATLYNLRPELVHAECPTVHTIPTPGLTRVSVSMTGQDAQGFSGDPSISDNGFVVTHYSTSTNLVPNDGNFMTDIFTFDLTPALQGDLNGDGMVNGLDLALLLGAWGQCPDPKGICIADLNGDASVNGLDLALLLGSWT